MHTMRALLVVLLLAAPALAGCLTGTSPLPFPPADRASARLAVVLAPDAPGPRAPGPAAGAAAAWDAVQFEHSLPLDVVFVAPSEAAATLRDRPPAALVLEELPSASDDLLGAATRYVAQGGVLVVLGAVGTRDPEGLERAAWPLADVLGVSVRGPLPAKTLGSDASVRFAQPWGPLSGEEPLLTDWVRSIPLAPERGLLVAPDGAEVRGELRLNGTTMPWVLTHRYGAGRAWLETLDLGGVAWRYHLGRGAGWPDPHTWSGWSHLHGLQWLALRQMLVESLPGPLPVLSPAPNGFRAILNFQLDLEGGQNVTTFAPTAAGRDAQAALALERARGTWAPGLLAANPWLEGHLETAIPLGIVCAEGGGVHASGARLVAWARSQGPVDAEGWGNNLTTGASAADFARLAQCVRTLRAAGLADPQDAWPSWCQFRSTIPDERYVEPWIEEGLLARVHFSGERTSTSFLAVPLSTSADTARDPLAYLVPQAYMTGFEEARPRADLQLLAMDASGLAPHIGWVRDDRQLGALAADAAGLSQRVLPLVQRGEAWFADQRSIARWLAARDRVDLHGYRVSGSEVVVQLTSAPDARGATIQLLGLPRGTGVLGADVDGVPYPYLPFPDRVVLPGLSPGRHELRLRIGPDLAPRMQPYTGIEGGLVRDPLAPSGVSDHAPRLPGLQEGLLAPPAPRLPRSG